MEKLRQIFLECGVKEEDIDGVIENLGVSTEEDLADLTNPKHYKSAGVKTILAQEKLAKYAKELAKSLEPEPEEEDETEVGTSLLTKLPDNTTWLKSLEQTGILQFDQLTYMAGLKATIAANLGVYAAVEKLMQLINDYSIANARQNPLVFYDLQDIVLTRRHGMPIAKVKEIQYNGVPIFATAEEMEALVKRIRAIFIPAILKSANTLFSWTKEFRTDATMNYFMREAVIPKDAAYPSTAPLYESGKALRRAVNQTFAGDGIQKSLALYFEYRDFSTALNNSELPAAVGAVDKDAVLDMLDFSELSAAAVMSEEPLTQFVIDMMNAPDFSGDSKKEISFFYQLHNMVRKVDWSILTGNKADSNLFVDRKKDPTRAIMTAISGMANEAEFVEHAETPKPLLTGPDVRTLDGRQLKMIGVEE